MNTETVNHPFGDICAERGKARYVIGVKTRNKYQANGLLNPTCEQKCVATRPAISKYRFRTLHKTNLPHK